jgi:hypothetical protein
MWQGRTMSGNAPTQSIAKTDGRHMSRTIRWLPKGNEFGAFALEYEAIAPPLTPGRNVRQFDQGVTQGEEVFPSEASLAASKGSALCRTEGLSAGVLLSEPLRARRPLGNSWAIPMLAALALFESGWLVGESDWLNSRLVATRRPATVAARPAASAANVAASQVIDWTVSARSGETSENDVTRAAVDQTLTPAVGPRAAAAKQQRSAGVPAGESDHSNAREPFPAVPIPPSAFIVVPRTPDDAPSTFKASKRPTERGASPSAAGQATPAGPAPAEYGWVSIPLPIEVQVLEGGRFVGMDDGKGIQLTAGSHQLELVNDTLNYRVRERIEIAAGRTTALAVTLPSGTLQLNAVPWAEVLIDGREAGQTPLANVQIPIGWHRVVFRHPELGEETRSIVVGVDASVRVGVDLRK